MDPQLQQMMQAMAQFGVSVSNGRGALNALNSQMGRLRMEMQRGTGTVQSNAAALNSLLSGYDNLRTSVQQSANGMALLRDAQAAAAKITTDAVGQMAMSLTKGGIGEAINLVTSQLYASIGAYQAGASGLETMFASQNAAIESQIRVFDRLTAGADVVATTFAMIPNPIAKGISAMAGLAHAALGVGKNLVELDQKNIQMLQTEIKNMGLSFGLLEKNGAAVSGGFDGMREAAGVSQLYQEEFSKVVVRNKNDLLEFGNTVNGGVTRFKAVNGEINKLATEGRYLRRELTLAGISAEEQADGLIQYMEMINKSGQLQKMTDRELAIGHAEYLKNMKAVSMFTGEDAKQAQARAKQASEQLAVQAKLEKQGPKAFERFTTAVATMGPEIQKGLQQMTAFDGTIVDKNLNQLLAASPTRKKLLEETYADMQNSALSSEEVNKRYQQRVAEYGDALKKEALDAGETYGAVNLATGQMGEVTGMLEKQAELGRKGIAAKAEENKAIETTVEKLKGLIENTDGTRRTLVELDRTVRENLLTRMNQLTAASSIYLQGQAGGKGAVAALKEQQAIDARTLTELTDKILGRFAAESGGIMSRVADSVTTGLAKTIDMLTKAAKGLDTVVAKILSILPKAKGGIVNSPTLTLSGEAGPEAIIPVNQDNYIKGKIQLPDPKTMLEGVVNQGIGAATASPVEINQIVDTVTASMTGMTNQLTIQKQMTDSKLDELIQAMRDKTIFEDMLEQFKETADNTRRMANELS